MNTPKMPERDPEIVNRMSKNGRNKFLFDFDSIASGLNDAICRNLGWWIVHVRVVPYSGATDGTYFITCHMWGRSTYRGRDGTSISIAEGLGGRISTRDPQVLRSLGLSNDEEDTLMYFLRYAATNKIAIDSREFSREDEY